MFGGVDFVAGEVPIGCLRWEEMWEGKGREMFEVVLNGPPAVLVGATSASTQSVVFLRDNTFSPQLDSRLSPQWLLDIVGGIVHVHLVSKPQRRAEAFSWLPNYLLLWALSTRLQTFYYAGL